MARGVIYDGPIYGAQADALCLECIASGAASAALSRADSTAEFTSVDVGVPPDVPEGVLKEVATRTPGFSGWQEEHWLYHCSDAMAYLGRIGYPELRAQPDAMASLRRENESFGMSAERSEEWITRLDRDGGATAYLFRCLACGAHAAYSDMS